MKINLCKKAALTVSVVLITVLLLASCEPRNENESSGGNLPDTETSSSASAPLNSVEFRSSIKDYKEVWGDVDILRIPNIHGAPKSPIDDNGDVLFIYREILSQMELENGKKEHMEVYRYNIFTGEKTVIMEQEIGAMVSFAYAGGNEKYWVFYEYYIYSTAPIPKYYMVYDKESGEFTKIDFEGKMIIEADNGGQFVAGHVSIYDDVLYFELMDRLPDQSEGDYGISIYRFDMRDKKLKLFQDHGGMPFAAENGLYYLDLASDGESGSVYLRDWQGSSSKELLRDIAEFWIYDGKIAWTRNVITAGADSAAPDQPFITGKAVGFYDGENNRELINSQRENFAWEISHNGRFIGWGTSSAPNYVYDLKNDTTVKISNASGALSITLSDRYMYWTEVGEGLKGQAPVDMCIIDLRMFQ